LSQKWLNKAKQKARSKNLDFYNKKIKKNETLYVKKIKIF